MRMRKRPAGPSQAGHRLRYEIAQRKRIEEALRQSEEYFRCLVQNSSDMIAVLDVDGTIRYQSSSLQRVLGYTPEDLLGKSAFAFVHPDDLPHVMQAFTHVVQNPRATLSVELRFKHACGGWRYLESTGSNSFASPSVAGIVVNSRDITERKQAEQGNSLLASIVASSDDAIISTTPDGFIVSWNPGAEKTYGYTADEVRGKHIAILISPTHCDQVQELLERIRHGQAINQFEAVSVRKDGRHIYVSLTLSPIKDSAGAITGVSSIARDITERRELAVVEERARIAREMHDSLAQVLGYVNTKAQAVQELLRSAQTDRAAAQVAQLAEAARAAYADVREDILGLRTSVGPERNLLQTLSDYLQRWQEQNGIPIDLVMPPDLCDFEVPPVAELQLVRIVQEALSNVRKHARATRAHLRLRKAAGWVEAVVEDDGIGFDPARLDPKAGPRFGLATMRERAEAVGGRLEIASIKGCGTSVTVYLPSDLTVVRIVGGAHARLDRR